MSDWESCVRFLKRAQVVPSSCNVNNVMKLIKDGSALCRLLNVLQPLSVDSKMISVNPKNSKFLSFKNINVFIETCLTTFGLRREDMFQINDLLNEENPERVLKTLSRLFNTTKAIGKLGNGIRKDSTTTPPLEEKIYQRFRKVPLPSEENYNAHQEEEECIYNRVIDLIPKNSSVEKKSPMKLRIDELISTEKNYVQLLKNLLEKYKVKLSKVLSFSELNLIFSLIERMYEVHNAFCSMMIETQEDDSRMTIAECFINNKEKFLVYGTYCSIVKNIQDLIDDLLTRPACQVEIEECQKSWPNADIKFKDLFVVPVQRMLKYPLFIKSCLDSIAEASVERKVFSKALEEIEDLAQYVNEMKRDYENISNISKIESSVKGIELYLARGTYLKDYGRLLKDGEIKCKTLNKLCLLFLFDQLLLVCVKEKESGLLELSRFFMVSQFHLVSKHKSDKGFALLYDQQVTEFKAKTKEERDDWVNKMEMAKDNTSPVVPWVKGTPPPKLEMHTYNEITICDVCRKLLKGLFFQGYLCSSPRFNVHKECIPKLQHADISVIGGTLPHSLLTEPWFAGSIDRTAAESILNRMPDGTYLVRKKGLGHVVCLKYGQIHHMLVKTKQGQFGLAEEFFPTIQDLVEFYGKNSFGQTFAKLHTKLVYPYKSFLSST